MPRSFLLLSLCAVACGGSAHSGAASPGPTRTAEASQAPDGFWDHWGDGKGELAGYALKMVRYGELRQGEAVLITVTEDFTAQQRVKSDGGHGDEYPVIKLNEVRDFQTGFYDYNVMTSSFLALDGRLPRGVPTKLSFSMQEWCGHAYEQLLFDATDQGVQARRTAHSYFDGEADRSDRPAVPAGMVSADALPMLVRGLTGTLVEPGASRTVPLLPRLLDLRMQHEALSWPQATITRAAQAHTREVPAGSFEVERWTVQEGELTTTFEVETAPPHRLVAWSRSDGEEAVLTGVVRRAYWQDNQAGGEALRAELGLPARPWP